MLNVSQGVSIVVDLDYIVLVNTVDRSVCSPSYLFTAFDGDHAVRFFDRHHLREAGHFKYLINI